MSETRTVNLNKIIDDFLTGEKQVDIDFRLAFIKVLIKNEEYNLAQLELDKLIALKKNRLKVLELAVELAIRVEDYHKQATYQYDYSRELIANVTSDRALVLEKVKEIMGQVLSLEPKNIQYRCYMAQTHLQLGDFQAAENELKLVYKPDNSHVEVLVTFAVLERFRGKADQALVYLGEALARDPKHINANINLALIRLSRAEFQDAWPKFQFRHALEILKFNQRFPPKFQWRGQDLSGKTILIHAEQGAGDTFIFIRYLKKLKCLGATIFFDAPSELCTLLTELPYIDYVIDRSNAQSDLELLQQPLHYHSALLDLVPHFTNSIDDIPNEIPYITVNSESIVKWRDRLKSDKKLKVGFVWHGNPKNPTNVLRSCPLLCFTKLFNQDETEFYSLQKGGVGSGLDMYRVFDNVHDIADELEDYVDTAAAIANLDLVISTCTSVAHLAAAMGKPTWVLLAYDCYWLWFRERQDSPWYPTVRLFRQQSCGDWCDVFERVSQALSEFR